jgi:putative phosphoesterase
MDKIAVIADVHGNLPALQAVLDEIATRDVGHIYCLGDLVGYYSMINEVISALRERGVTSILGNHDYALVHRGGAIPRSRSATLILERQRSYISSENLAYLAQLPTTLEFSHAGRTFFAVHGGLDDAMDEYIREISVEYLERHRFQPDVLLSGQTHVPMHVTLGRQAYANPGSVGQSRDGDPRASYLIVDGQDFTFHRVRYEATALVEHMLALGFPPEFHQKLIAGLPLSSRIAAITRF